MGVGYSAVNNDLWRGGGRMDESTRRPWLSNGQLGMKVRSRERVVVGVSGTLPGDDRRKMVAVE